MIRKAGRKLWNTAVRVSRSAVFATLRSIVHVTLCVTGLIMALREYGELVSAILSEHGIVLVAMPLAVWYVSKHLLVDMVDLGKIVIASVKQTPTTLRAISKLIMDYSAYPIRVTNTYIREAGRFLSKAAKYFSTMQW